MKIYLIGFMGAGKTYLGLAAAPVLHLNFIDTDYEVTKLGKPINYYFETGRVCEFRALEAAILQNIGEDCLIATGGGIVETPTSRDFLKNQCTIWLDVPWELTYERIKNSFRPLLSTLNRAQLRKLYEKRKPYYQECSRYVFHCTENIPPAKFLDFIKEIYERVR